MINLTIDGGNALPTTGTGVYTLGLLEALRKYSSSDFRIMESNICSNSSSLRPLHRLIYLRRLRKKQLECRDISPVFHFTNVYVPKKLRPIGFVGTIHDLDPIYFPETFSGRYRFYFQRAVRNSAVRSDVILTDSEASRQLLIDFLNGCETKIKVARIGVSLDFMEQVDNVLKTNPTDVLTLMFVGSLSKKKNTAWLIRTTYEGVRKGALPKLKLLLVGNAGYGFNEIEKALRDAGDIVCWKSGVSKNELAKLYIESSAIVLPSFTEGFGLPLIEAMYCRKPIIASRIPSSVEVAANAAQYFDLNDIDGYYSAVRIALEDQNCDERVSFISNHLSKYLWKNLVHDYEAVYRNVVVKS
jgi:glycosyltransferase involved in cell wall biosynthesis